MDCVRAVSGSDNTDTDDRIVDLEERTWLPRHCRGDKNAFAALMNAYRAPVYGYLVRCGLDAASRDDLFQDVFMRIHTAAASYQSSRPLRPWIFTIAANAVRNHLRAERHRPTVSSEDGLAEYADPAASVERQAQLHQQIDQLDAAIAQLPFEQREALLLAVVEGLRERDVAGIVGAPLNTVKTRIRRARVALASALIEPDLAGAMAEYGVEQGGSDEDL